MANLFTNKTKFVENIKVFLKKKKKKSHNMSVIDTKIFQKMKYKGWLSIERNIKWERAPYHNYKKLFCIKKSTSIQTLFRMGFFGAAHGWVGVEKGPPSLKSVTHILQ